MSRNKELEEALRYDPLAEAEKIFGKNTPESQAASLFGMMEHSAKKEKLLDALGDSKFSNKIEDYINIISGIGFQMIFKERFVRKESGKDTLYVYWHDDLGILLTFDTYNNTSVNGADFYYNILFKLNLKDRHLVTSSGSFKQEFRDFHYYNKDGSRADVKDMFEQDPETRRTSKKSDDHNKKLHNKYYGVWVGNHDGREGVVYKVKGLEESGKLLKQWIKPGFININHGDDEDRTEESLRRLSMFPENVKERICYEEIVKEEKNYKEKYEG